MSGSDSSAVRDRIKITFTPIPGRMEPDREPQIAGPSQRQTKEKADENRSQNSNPAFSRISQMKHAKTCRQQDRGPPETHRKGQAELGITTSEEFFVETDDQKECGPEQGELKRACSV